MTEGTGASDVTYVGSKEDITAWMKRAEPGDVAVYHCGPLGSLLQARKESSHVRAMQSLTSLLANKDQVALFQRRMPHLRQSENDVEIYEYRAVRISTYTANVLNRLFDDSVPRIKRR